MSIETSAGCPFCAPDMCEIVFLASPEFQAFSTIAPILPGHVLVAPKRHVMKITDLSDYEASAIMLFSRRLLRLLGAAFKTSDFNWVIQAGEAAGQTVSHLHLHLIPRKQGDLPNPGDWYPRLKTMGDGVVDSEHRQRLERDEMCRIADHLRQIGNRMRV